MKWSFHLWDRDRSLWYGEFRFAFRPSNTGTLEISWMEHNNIRNPIYTIRFYELITHYQRFDDSMGIFVNMKIVDKYYP